MDQELHEAVVEFTESAEEIRRFWEQFGSTPTKAGKHWTAEDKTRYWQLQDKVQKASKRMRDASLKKFGRRP